MIMQNFTTKIQKAKQIIKFKINNKKNLSHYIETKLKVTKKLKVKQIFYQIIF